MNKIRMMVALLFGFVSSGFCEVPQFIVSPDKMFVDGVEFGVHYMNWDLRHDQFEIRHVIVSVSSENITTLRKSGYVRVWRENEFIFSASIPTTEQAPISIRDEIHSHHTHSPLLFSLQINPLYLDRTIFTYQLRDSEGRAKLNCVIYLKEFIE